MLDVHPPHHAANTWRDFLIHIATIVVGLLIAIGLEQSVEWFHGRHILHHTENNLRAELQHNRALLKSDELLLDKGEEQIERNLQIEGAALAHRPAAGNFSQDWNWEGPRSAAWETAQSNGALALMPYDVSESLATVYEQQKIVDQQTTLYIRDIYKVYSPFSRNRKLADLSPEEIRQVIADEHQLLADLRLLRDLCHGLDDVYDAGSVTLN